MRKSNGIARRVELSPQERAAIEARANARPPLRVACAGGTDVPLSFRAGLVWFVVYTNINCEQRAKKGLDALGYTTFLPVVKKWIRHARRRVAVERPLFARYLFVALDPARDGWFAIRTTHGVERVLARDGVPESVPAAAIATLMAAERAGRFDLTLAAPRLKAGDKVAVEGGPFGDFVAEVATADDGKRVEVLHRLFGRLTRMKVDLARVRQKAEGG
jgi:transcriptional antiterminator RfaH